MPTTSGPHIARAWVLDLKDIAVIDLDAEPDIIAARLTGSPIKRNGKDRSLQPKTTGVDELTPEKMKRLFDRMNEKYGDRQAATAVYYCHAGTIARPGCRHCRN